MKNERNDFISKLHPNGRLTFPSRLRKKVGTTFVIANSVFTPCVQACSIEEWDRFEKSIYEKNHPENADELFRKMGNIEVQIDEQGRFPFEKSFREYANITDEVYFKPVGQKIELWNEKELLSKMAEKTMGDIAKEINF
ncbi:MAG: hypothetical protein FWF94_05570 [Oscillospiraceae bacterium]|nr:hypothetical protein [Oscillospiraceae bacterium]